MLCIFLLWRSLLTVKFTKPWTPEIFMECYCVARNKPIRHVITKLQTATVISLWFWGLIAYPKLYCNWPVHNQHSWNFSCVQGFLSLIVKRRPKLNNFWLKRYKIKLKRFGLTTLISYMCIELKYGLSYGIAMKIIEKIKQTRAIDLKKRWWSMCYGLKQWKIA